MIDTVELLTPVIQGLAVNAFWAVGRELTRASLTGSRDNGFVEELFTAQTLDSEEITQSIARKLRRNTFPHTKLPDVVTFLNLPDVQVCVHQLLTSRLLEQPASEIDPILSSMTLLARGHFGSDDPEIAGEISGHIFEAADAACHSILLHLDTAGTDVRDSIVTLAGFSSIATSLKGVERHLAHLQQRHAISTSEWPSFEANYRVHMSRRHGVIIPPDLDEERRVDVEDLYVEAELSVDHDKRPAALPDALSEYGRIVVTGNPGGGKSTLASVTTFRLSSNPSAKIPFHVTLREYSADYEEGLSIVEHLERMIKLRMQSEPPRGWLESKLVSGTAAVIFDGLDELLEPMWRREIRDAVEEFCVRYPFAPILVTSRHVGYSQAPLSDRSFTLVRLGEFSVTSVSDYVKKWFTVVPTTLDEVARIDRVNSFLSESATVTDIRSNPLMLSLMCVLYRGEGYIPESRLSLYGECAKLLFRKWDRSRGLHVKLEIGSDLDAALMHLAHWVLTSGNADEGVTETTLVNRCVDYLVPRRFEERDDARFAAEQFVEFCRGRAWILADAGLNEQNDTLYTFTHRTFLEYYAASQFVRVHGSPEAIATALAPHLAIEGMEVVSQLALQIVDRNYDSGGDRLILHLLNETRKQFSAGTQNILRFVCRALSTHISAPSTLRTVTRIVFENTLLRYTSEPASAEPAAAVQSEDSDWPSGSHPDPLSDLLWTHNSNLRVVGDELAKAVLEALNRHNCEEPQWGGAFLVGALPHVLLQGRWPDRERRYEHWSGWASMLVASLESLETNSILDHQGLAVASAATEHGRLDFSAFAERGLLGSLFVHLGSPYRLGRVGTLDLLAGWLTGAFRDEVFVPGMPIRLLSQIPSIVKVATFPQVVDAEHTATLVSTEESRFDKLRGASRAGALILMCMLLELDPRSLDGGRRMQSESCDDSIGTDAREYEYDEVGGFRRKSIRHLPSDVAQLAVHYAELRRSEPKSVAFEGDACWAAEEAPEVHSLLTRWAKRDLTFFELDVPEAPPDA